MSAPTMTALYAPKHGAPEEEWEDAASYDEAHGLGAIADGAGSSYRSARWSSKLVESFVVAPPALAADLGAFVGWVGEVGDEFQAASEAVSDTSWYAADASRRGSFATFAGIRLVPGDTVVFDGVVVGDACLFVSRQGTLVAASQHDADAFDSTPDLLGSSPYQDSYGAERGRYLNGTLAPGDVMLLATDALSAAMLRLAAAGQPVWSTVEQIGPAAFAELVARLRASGVMEDDDVTLLRVRMPEVAA